MLDSLSKMIIIIIMNSIVSIQMDNLNFKKESDIQQKYLEGYSGNSPKNGISALHLHCKIGRISAMHL